MFFSVAAKNAVETPENLKGIWKNANMSDYYITIRGTNFTEFLFDDDSAGEWDMLSVKGDIVDITGSGEASSILYIKVINGGQVFNNKSFIAVAWQKRSNGNVEFATGNYEKATLAAIKSKYNNVSAFPSASFHSYEK